MKGKIIVGLMSLLLVACSQLPIFEPKYMVDCTSGKYSVPDNVATDMELRGQPELGYVTVSSDGEDCILTGFLKHPKKYTILGNEVVVETATLGTLNMKCGKLHMQAVLYTNPNATKDDKYQAAINHCFNE